MLPGEVSLHTRGTGCCSSAALGAVSAASALHENCECQPVTCTHIPVSGMAKGWGVMGGGGDA